MCCKWIRAVAVLFLLVCWSWIRLITIDSISESNQILLLIRIWEPQPIIRSLCKDVGPCHCILLCSCIRRVRNLNLLLLTFQGEKQFENLWCYCVDNTRLFCKSSTVYESLIHVTVPVVGLAPAKKCWSMCLTANHWGDPTDIKFFEGDDPFLLQWLTVGRTRATTSMCTGFRNIFCWLYLSWYHLFNKLQHGNICAAFLLLCELFILSERRKRCFKSFNQ